MNRERVISPAVHGLQRSVSVISGDEGALYEVAHALAREGIGISQHRIVQVQDVSGVLDAFQAVRRDPATEIVVLAIDASAPAAVQPFLDQVRQGQKPTVVCLPGGDLRLAWRAGAIPAVRLDEAALRAVAWVRNWDQALITSRLEEERDELTARAGELQSRIGPKRHLVRGLFASDALRREAQFVLVRMLGGEGPFGELLDLSAGLDVTAQVEAAWADPACAAFVLSLVLSAEKGGGPVYEAVAALRACAADGPLPIAHVCRGASVSSRLTEVEASLAETGAVVMPGNASAALLAGLLIQRGTKGG